MKMEDSSRAAEKIRNKQTGAEILYTSKRKPCDEGRIINWILHTGLSSHTKGSAKQQERRKSCRGPGAY